MSTEEMEHQQTTEIEQLRREEIKPSYYVGMGASAGGLEAIEDFFKKMPPESGLAFIIIQHLSPDYKSLMVQLLSKHTEMPIYRAEENMEVKKDSVYLIPPKKNLTIFHGKLLLSEQDHSKGINLPIDVFFRSLAEDQAENAIGIILSGTGSDGTRGVRAIKELGGMVMVQAEDSAKFDGMPRSAIDTGLADFILSPAEMPGQLVSFVKHPYASKSEFSEKLLTNEDGLTRIFSLLREKHKIDFTYYKPSTVIRRIERRISVNQIQELRDYVKYMESYPKEISNLYRELLIGVTNFFRDPDAFRLLAERWLPKLLEKEAGNEVRFWVAGCSTGEEAYTLAIICQECMEQIGKRCNIKIFATDIDRHAILTAGNGIYPESIAADLDPELLNKYFYRKENNTFHIIRSIREMVVFARHNIIKDPPFTNINLVSCRNLLIYLQPVLQKKVLELFNFSLNSQGILFLGSSETTGEMSEYFESVEHKWKIYLSRGKALAQNLGISNQFEGKVRATVPRFPRREAAVRLHEEERILDRVLQAFSEEYFACAFVVNEQMELLHVIGDTQGYLRFPPGKVLNDVSKIAAKDLAIPLATGVQRVLKTREEVLFSNIRIKDGDAVNNLRLRLKLLPEKKQQDRLVLIFIEKNRPETLQEQEEELASYDISREAEQHIHDLQQELQYTRENLQATIEELETSNEELQATNEELLASNEELQSTNEELQSVNEELYTVNAEYQRKIMELTELNHDMDNLLTSSEIATLFLDENLDIRKYTSHTANIFHIMDTDIGRPLAHLTLQLSGLDINEIVRHVLNTGEMVSHEIQSDQGKWYLLKAAPYYITPNVFSGVVLTFIDITDRKKSAKEAVFQDKILQCLDQAIITTDLAGNINYWNYYAQKLYQWSAQEAIGKNILDLKLLQNTKEQRMQIMSCLQANENWYGEYKIQRKDQTSFLARVKNSPIVDDSGELAGVIAIVDEIKE
ncbi:MAG: PAS domain-containing protein [SAR324 cluster bacterium]|nr:PAS domain-containing protein [SAR324 cluster bacterium]